MLLIEGLTLFGFTTEISQIQTRSWTIQVLKGFNMKIILALNTQDGFKERETIEALGLPFKVCLGSYKGKLERSYMVKAKTLSDNMRVFELAMQHGQESVLTVDRYGNASLLYLDGSKRIENVGNFGEIDRDMQGELDNWTLTEDGKLFTTLA